MWAFRAVLVAAAVAAAGADPRLDLMHALVPAFEPSAALRACRAMKKGGVNMQPGAAVPVGQSGQPQQRIHLLTFVVTAWTEVQRSGQAGPNHIPSLSSGTLDVVIKLLDCLADRGVSVNTAPEEDNPLLLAVHSKAPRLAAWLLSAGADPSSQASEEDPYTSLHAATGNRVETASLAKELLSGDARIVAWLDWLLRETKSLVQGEAVADARAAVGEALLLFDDGAVRYPRSLLLRVANLFSGVFVSSLLSHGAGEAADYTGRTPLHVAASANNAVAASLLCAAGFHSQRKDKTKRTPWQLAVEAGNAETAAAMASCADAPEFNPGSVPSHRELYPAQHAPLDLTSRVAAVEAAGGWASQTPASHLDIDFCDVEQVHARDLSAADFFRRFYSTSTPVVVRGDAVDWKMMKHWRRNAFVKEFGDRKFPVGRIPYPSYFGEPTDAMVSVRDLVACMMGGCDHSALTNASSPLYVFERGLLDQIAPELTNDFPPVPLPFRLPPVMQQQQSQPQFFVGPPQSGAPVHFHGDAWNAVAFGAKRWFLYPPQAAFYSKEPVAEWVAGAAGEWHADNDAAPLQCVQRAGDVMFVPRDWGHGVINLDNTIGVATEFTTFFSRY